MPSLSEKVAFLEKVFGTAIVAKNKRNIAVRCPICNPTDRSKRKLAICADDDRLHCWTCGFKARTLVPLLRRFATADEFNEYVKHMLPKGSFVNERQKEKTKELELPLDFRLLVKATDPDAKAAYRYARSRGIDDHDMWLYKIGYSDDSKWRRRVFVPSFDSEGKVNYYVGRAIDKKHFPKYENPSVDKNAKTLIVFNEVNVVWNELLVLCEGVFDMFNCGDNVVPLLGSDLNEESAVFSSILVNSTPIALALDADMWNTKTPAAVKKLSAYGIDVRVVDTRSFGDPGNATKQQFADALANAFVPGWDDMFALRLGAATRTSLSI